MKNIILNKINPDELIAELEFQTTRSSGKGGQNVNKVSTKVIVIFDIEKSQVLNEVIKKILYTNISGKITQSSKIKISSSKERSQLMNKKDAINKFIYLINKALEPVEERIATKPTKSSKKERLLRKTQNSIQKKMRGWKLDNIDE